MVTTAYLATLEPWSGLPTDAAGRLAAGSLLRAFSAGDMLFDAGAEPEGVFILAEGQVRVDDGQGTQLSELGPGGAVGGRRLLRSEPNPIRATALTDGTAILVPKKLFRQLVRTHSHVRAFFAPARTDGPRRPSLALMQVSQLMSADPVCIAPDTPISEAADRMREAGISSVLVTEAGRISGIVTVRDISARVVADRRDPDGPVAGIMTRDPLTLPPEAAGSDVLHLMMERSISHIPVAREGRVLGVVSKTDLTRVQAETSAEVIGDASSAGDVEALAAVTARIPSLLRQLVGAGNRHEVVTRYITDVADAVTRRLLAMAEDRLGPPPVPYLWAACGSQGRREQTGVSDQDNVLILSDDMTPGDDAYFERLAGFVSDGLNACGYVYCPGDMMATNPRWRQPVAVWQDYFATWIAEAGKEAQMLASVMFDLRPIGGDIRLFEGLQAQVLERAQRNSIFVAHMASNALGHQPPLGLFRGLATVRSGEHRDTIDMKMSGVVPVVDLARIYALRGGLAEVNTRARIEAAIRGGGVAKGDGRDLLDAYDMIAQTRLEHQAAQVRDGHAPDNFMAPARLSQFERSHLRDAFLIVRTRQSALGRGPGIR